MRNKNHFIQSIKPTLLFCLLVLLNQTSSANGSSEYYQAKDGKVDAATFTGWNSYNYVCVTCHGIGAVGTKIAPDLTEIADRLSFEQFKLKVLHQKAIKFTGDDWRSMEQSMLEEIAKQEKRDQGELANMPRWEYNPSVTNNVKNIYRYLKARADGVIGPDKPGLLKE